MAKLYTVRIVQHRTMDFSVEADSLEEAVAKARADSEKSKTWHGVGMAHECVAARQGAVI